MYHIANKTASKFAAGKILTTLHIVGTTVHILVHYLEKYCTVCTVLYISLPKAKQRQSTVSMYTYS
jgi:hypothetical protein